MSDTNFENIYSRKCTSSFRLTYPSWCLAFTTKSNISHLKTEMQYTWSYIHIQLS